MLAMSLAGSAIDILLQPNVAGYVGTQATDLKDLGETQLGGERMHAFEVQWAGARVQIYFAAEGDPLLKQFTRIVWLRTSQLFLASRPELRAPVASHESLPRESFACREYQRADWRRAAPNQRTCPAR